MTLHTDTGFQTGTYRVTRRSKGTYVDGVYVRTRFLDADATVNAVLNTITIAGHGASTGDGPVWLTTSDTVPGGLSTDTPYWLIRLTDDVLQLATNRADALADTEVLLSDAGVGTLHVASFFLLVADVQPLQGRDLQDLEEGQLAEDMRTVFTDTELLTRHPDFDPDVMTIDGDSWRVKNVKHFTVLSGHYVATVERLKTP